MLLCNKRAVEGSERGRGGIILGGTDAVLKASFWLRLRINVVAQYKAVYPVAFRYCCQMRSGSCTPIICEKWWPVAILMFNAH